MDPNFLKLISELHRLTREGFKGKVVINFDGKGAKDLIMQTHRLLEEIEIEEGTLADLKKIAKALGER